jgi:hypothetical protein
MSRGFYLFCLTPKNPLLEIEGTGMDESHPLCTKAIADVVAVFSEVFLEDFCGPEACERLADLAWVAPRALRHEEVIMTIMRQAPVLPVRFGSVFSSLDALGSSLGRHRGALSRFFLDTAGQKEWTLKAFVDRPQAKSRIITARLAVEKEQFAGLAPGKRYLLEQKIKGVVDREATLWLKKIADDIVMFFKEVSSASSEGRLVSQELTGRGDEMFFHAALLVPDRSVERLQRLTVEWNAGNESMGLHLESSGPWPPYRFTPVLDTQG